MSWDENCPNCNHKWLEHICPIEKKIDKYCEVCGVPLPINAIRTHDGKWKCWKHK
jgi:transcription elongation factor Elf1